MKSIETEVLLCTHFLIDYMIDPPPNRPRLITVELGQLSPEQLAELYQSFGWAIVALFCHRHKALAEQLFVLHSAVVTPVSAIRSSDFQEALHSVLRAGGADFMGLKLFESITVTLKLKDESPAGGFLLIVLLNACMQKIERINGA